MKDNYARPLVQFKEVESQINSMKGNERDEFLNSILVNSPGYAIVALDLNDNIVIWNEGAHQIYGYSSDDILNKKVFVLHDPLDISSGKLRSILTRVMKDGRWSGELIEIRKNNEKFVASVMYSTRTNSEGQLVGFTKITQDLSIQKRLESDNRELEKNNSRIQEANRMKSEFLTSMSHELRTPLNGIIGFAELMYHGKVGEVSAEHHEYLGDILHSARHLLQLINDILDLAKVESGKIHFKPEVVDVNILLKEVNNILQPLIFHKQIKLNQKIHPDLKTIFIDPSRFKQILYNYLSNAIKFSKEHDEIDINIFPENETMFRLEIRDRGIGIQEKNLDKLFIEFEQFDSNHPSKHVGTGLGLALTRRITEALGGRVGAHSTLGQGSVFFAILPRNQVSDAT